MCFGGNDLRWGIFWKCLKYSLENAALIIEGSTKLHNFLVDYRESKQECEAEFSAIQEIHTFEQGLRDNSITPIAVGNREGIGSGRPSNSHILSRTDGLRLMDQLKNNLQNYNMHRPRNSEWNEDDYTHVVRTV